jgi:hypothetical protein
VVCNTHPSLIPVGSGHQFDREPTPRSVNNFIKLRSAAAQKALFDAAQLRADADKSRRLS